MLRWTFLVVTSSISKCKAWLTLFILYVVLKKTSKDERMMAKALRSQQLQAQGVGADGDSVNLLDPADFFARNYDNIPLEFFLIFLYKSMIMDGS